MLTKSVTPARLTVKDGDAGEVEAVFATLKVIDHDGDVILPGAIAEGAPIVVSSYGHKSWDGKLPVGKGTMHEVGDELVARMSFFTNTTHGADTYNTVKGLGDQGEWSFSLQDVTSTNGDWHGTEANLISGIGRVKEVSPVLIGAGINTRTLSVKADGMKFSEHMDAVLADVRVLVDRAQEVVTLRAAKGKSIGDDAAASLADLGDELARIKSLFDDADTTNPNDDIEGEYLRFVCLTQGVTTS